MSDCDHCEIANRGEAFLIGGLMFGFCIGMLVSVGFLKFGSYVPDKRREIVMEANECYDNGQRAVLIRGEVECR